MGISVFIKHFAYCERRMFYKCKQSWAFSGQNISQYFCVWELGSVTSVLILQQNKLLAYVEVQREIS